MSSTATARIQLTIEITGSSYGDDWNLANIIRQASSESKVVIKDILKHKQVVIIGEPIVKTITTMQDLS